MEPVIGISTDFTAGSERSRPDILQEEPTQFLRYRYVRIVADLGGLPVALPLLDETRLINHLVDRIDGLLLTGSGPDLDPRLYGQWKRYSFSQVRPERAKFEILIARAMLRANKPIFGICGGLQLLNVAMGGTLYQDIASQIDTCIRHRSAGGSRPAGHWVRIVPGTLLHRTVRSVRIRVNSAHHQAPNQPGRGLVVNATAADGIVEGLESPDRDFVLGVQWHPENLYSRDEIQRRLFKAFLTAARKERR